MRWLLKVVQMGRRMKSLCVGVWLVGNVLLAQTDVGELLEQKLLRRVKTFDDSLTGVLGVAAIDLKTGRTLHITATLCFRRPAL